MKKFLTVLLALSVVFTYTVGTAFAVTTDEYQQYYSNVDAAERQVKSAFQAIYDAAVNGLDESDVATDYTVSVEAWKEAAKVYHADIIGAIEAETKTFKENCTDATKTKTIAEIAGEYTTPTAANAAAVIAIIKNTAAGTDPADVKYVNAAARAQFAIDKADALKKAGLVAVNGYDSVTRDIKFDDGTVVTSSYAELAAKAKADLIAAIEAVTIADDAAAATVETAADKLDITGIVENPNSTTTPKAWKFVNDTITVQGKNADTHVKLKTADQIANEDLLDKATKENVRSLLAAKSSEIYSANVAKKAAGTLNAQQFEDAEAVRVALIAAAGYLVEVSDVKGYAGPSITDLQTMINGFNVNTLAVVDEAVGNTKLVEELEAYAAKYKVEKNADGEIMRDADAIDKVVMAAKVDAFKDLANPWKGLAAAKDAIKNDCYAENQALEFAKAAKKAQLEKAKAEASDDYYAKELPDVEKAYDDAIAKIASAKSTTEVDNIAAVLYLIKDKTAVKASISSAVATEKAGELDSYETYINSNKADKDKVDIDNLNWVEFYAEKGARSAAEIKALLADAKAKIDSLNTAGTIADQKAAVEKMIKELPTAIALTDKDAVKAAWDANETYEANFDVITGKTVYNKAILTADIAALFTLEDNALKAEIAKLPAVSRITLADKAAVKELAAKVNALVDMADADSGDMYAGQTVTANMDRYLEEIQKLDAKAVMDAIKALPLNITAADKTAVKAAREAYNAYVEEYTVYAPAADKHNAVLDITNRSELFDAEEAVKVLDIKAVEALKITASSKAGKGYIKVSWKVKGDDTAADGYQIYRSVKRNSGFGTKPYFTTKNKTYKNTKSLKKGTRYYYKVRAYKTVNGVTYYSDWSNKAYRIAK